MARVVSMSAWRRIFCAMDGCTFSRASKVAVVWRSEWKTMPFIGSGRIQRRAIVVRAAAVRVVDRQLHVSAAGLATAVLVPVDDAGAAAVPAAIRGLEAQPPACALPVDARHVSP